jgi:NAD(P)-dependent dehydrogenase (short-subunit alcohol dehydrogenase family)
LSKVIVITGGGDGLGKHLGRRFAADGDRVVLLGRTASKLDAVASEIGDKAMPVTCDITKPDSVRAAFAQIAERHPKIDALINNAAYYEPSYVVEASDALIQDVIDINLTGAIFCCRAAIPMLDRGGHIINVTSESIDMPFRMLSLYQAAKAGLERFSLTLYQELADAGIRVTIARAGTMYDETTTLKWDAGLMQRFHVDNLANGLDFAKQPISHYTNVTEVFRSLLDLPPDVHVVNAQIHARRP